MPFILVVLFSECVVVLPHTVVNRFVSYHFHYRWCYTIALTILFEEENYLKLLALK